MSKWMKRLAGFAAIGAAIASIAYVIKSKMKKNSEDEFEEEFDDFDGDDLELDDDLGAVSDREYVTISKPSAKSDESAETSSDFVSTDDFSVEKTPAEETTNEE